MKVLLDTSALIALLGIGRTASGSDFMDACRRNGILLCVTHIQVDEKVTYEYHEYQTKVDRAVAALRKLGLTVQMQDTPIAVFGISRYGLAKYAGETESQLYDRLRQLISECTKKRGIPVKDANISRDAVIAVSALDHDVFAVCDECLSQSFQRAIINHPDLSSRVPKVVFTKADPESVATGILSVVESRRSQSEES